MMEKQITRHCYRLDNFYKLMIALYLNTPIPPLQSPRASLLRLHLLRQH